MALGISAFLGLTLGLAIGAIPYIRATMASFIAFLSLIPPLAILPILFIVAGLGELAKVLLIIIGVAPIIVRDLALRTSELPAEQIIKAQTLGASTWQLIIRVIMPQMWPRLIDALRLNLGVGMAVPHRLRGHRIDRRSRLSNLSGPAIYGDGRDPALCRVDHAAGIRRWMRCSASCVRKPSHGPTPGINPMTQITVKHLWKEYDTQVVLENVNLHIGDHEFVTIVGASGCGKTTFLRMLLGVETPSRGE